YADKAPDSDWVWQTLVPRLEQAGVRVAVSEDVLQPGVERVVGIERGIRQAKRMLLVLSDQYLADNWVGFEGVLTQTKDINEGTYSLLPVRWCDIKQELPGRLSMLEPVKLASPARAEREFSRLIAALKGPLPRRGPGPG